MRRLLNSQALKNHFQTAWICLPERTQGDLQEFIRQIREVNKIKGTYIGCPDGTHYGPLDGGAGYTFLYKDDSVVFCDIILSSSLAKASQAQAMCIILHELGHVLDYFIYAEKMVSLSVFSAENSAWDKVIAWAKDGIPNPALNMKIEYLALRAKIRDGIDELNKVTDGIIEEKDS